MKGVVDLKKKDFRDVTNKPLMFSENENKYGKLKIANYYVNFKKCEEFTFEEMLKYNTGISFDLGANQNPYFSVINYTNFSELFALHPLSRELSHFQTENCFINQEAIEFDYFNHFADKYKNENYIGKYAGQKTDISISEFEALVVLPGGNKFNIMCGNKIKHILHEHGTKAVFKLHPLTPETSIEYIKSILPAYATIVGGNECLYEYMKQSSIVYTSHSTESAFIASCMGKEISPIDAFQHSRYGTFSHINRFLFYNKNKRDIINKLLNNYRSGLFHPLLDKNWKEKISKYLEFIHEMRMSVKHYYMD